MAIMVSKLTGGRSSVNDVEEEGNKSCARTTPGDVIVLLGVVAITVAPHGVLRNHICQW